MIKAIICDFSRVLIFPKDVSYSGSLNEKHRLLSQDSSYKVLNHFFINEELLDFFREIKGKYKLYIFTSETIQEAEDIKEITDDVFDEVFSAMRMGIWKNETKAFLVLSEKIGIEPREVIFIDDSLENLEAAKKANFNTLLFKSNDELFKEFKKVL